jgi:spermidine synthase
VLAGGTLGAAARAAEHEGDRRRRHTGLLYGLNTLGATTGALLATFWLLEALGTRLTVWAAAALNLAVAGLAWRVSRPLAEAGAAESAVAEGERAATGAPPRFVLAAAACCGFVFFLLELVWYRMLGPVLGGTVYTFGLVLGTALLGIAAGGLLYPRVFARRAVGLGAFAVTCLLEAAAIAVPFAAGDALALLALDLRPAAGAGLAAYLAGWAVVTAIVVLPAAVVSGLQFPLLVALLGEGRARVAGHLGTAYFWNTLGGIAGALAGGFGLLPLLGAPGCWKLAGLLMATLAVVAVVLHRGPGRARGIVAGGALAVAGLLLLVLGPTAGWRHSGIGAGDARLAPAGGANARRAFLHDARRSVVWETEGVESSVAVQATAGLSFVVNGKVDGNARNDAPTQVMGGLLGALLHDGPRRALVVGLGTGSSAGWLAAVPGMERTDVVELEPAIVEVARMCAGVNQGALENPSLRVMAGDAREALTTSRESYDVVFSEPSNPYRAGVSSLFTREFYAAVARRLSPDGVFLQWVQAYEIDEWTFDTVAATLGSVFPDVQVWQVHHLDLLLVARARPRIEDEPALRARLGKEPFASALRVAWRAEALEDVLARFVAGSAVTEALRARGHEVNTDDRNRLEFAFARTLSRTGLFDAARLRARAASLGADRPALRGSVDWDRVARQRLAIHTIAGSAPPARDGLDDDTKARAEAHAQYLNGELAAAARTLLGRPGAPEGLVETRMVAEGLADAGDPAAVAHIKELGRTQRVEAEAATARLAFRMGQHELALGALATAFSSYRQDPWPDQVSLSRALALADELTLAEPRAVPVVLEALGQPFALFALEEPRRLMRLSVASHGRDLGRCREMLEPLEPWVPWRADVLRYRASCYERTADPRTARARADLQDFERSESKKP